MSIVTIATEIASRIHSKVLQFQPEIMSIVTIATEIPLVAQWYLSQKGSILMTDSTINLICRVEKSLGTRLLLYGDKVQVLRSLHTHTHTPIILALSPHPGQSQIHMR